MTYMGGAKMAADTTTDVAERTAKSSDDLRQSAKAVGDDLRDLGRAAKDVAQEKYEGVKRHAGDYVTQGRQKASEFEDQIEEYIRQKPLESVLIAVGAGALIGFLLGRK